MSDGGAPDRSPHSPLGAPGRPLVELVLYVSTTSAASLRAVGSLQAILADFASEQVHLEIRDVGQHAAQAEEDRVLFTPTLVKVHPRPPAWLVGAVDREVAVTLLVSCGVARIR